MTRCNTRALRRLRLVRRTMSLLRQQESAFERAQGYRGHLEDGFHRLLWPGTRRGHLTDLGLLHKGHLRGYWLTPLGMLVHRRTRTLRERMGLVESIACQAQRRQAQRRQEVA